MNEPALINVWLGCCQFLFWLYVGLAMLIIWFCTTEDPPKK